MMSCQMHVYTSQNYVVLLAGYRYSTKKNLEIIIDYLVPGPDNTWIPNQPRMLLVLVENVLRHKQFGLSSMIKKEALGL